VTLDASGNQIRPGVDPEQILPERLFPVTGPVAVQGVAAGDAVGVFIDAIRPEAHGHVWSRPGLGFGTGGQFAVQRYTVDDRHVPSLGSPTVRTPRQVHTGTLGVLPESPAPARSLGSYGGNLDVPMLQSGAMLWVRAGTHGAGVFAGDVHAAMG